MCVLVLTDSCLPALEQQCTEAAHMLVNFDLPRAGMPSPCCMKSPREGMKRPPAARASMVPRIPGRV